MGINQNTSPCCSSPNIVVSAIFHTQEGNCPQIKTVDTQKKLCREAKISDCSRLSVCHLILCSTSVSH